MIRFPETVQAEIEIIYNAASVESDLRKKIATATQVEVRLDKMRVDHEAKTQLQMELDAGATPELEMGTLADYNAKPSGGPADLISGVFKRNDTCIFTGPGGSGKTTSALQMLHCLMTGDDWLGQPVTKITGSVGILSYDMDASMVYDWMKEFPGIDPARVFVVNAYKRGNPLNVPEMRARIASTWQANDVEVVMLDSFSASFFGSDQNNIAEVQNHYRDIIKFALTDVEASGLLVIAHSTPGTPEKIRGATAHHEVSSSIVAQYPATGTSGPRTVRMVKYRQHRDISGVMTHQMNPVVISEPDDVTHLVTVDPAAMTMVGMPLSTAAAVQSFPDLPDENEPPDTDSDSGNEDDDL